MIIDPTLEVAQEIPLPFEPSCGCYYLFFEMILIKIAMASLDPLAMDCLVTKMMLKGFDPLRIGYLRALGQVGMGQADVAKVNVIGESVENCQYDFRFHRRMAQAYGIEQA